MAAPVFEPGLNSLDPETRADILIAAFGGLDTADLNSSEVRRAISAVHPFAFALMYLSHHLVDSRKQMTFADLHLDLCDLAAREWRDPNPLKGGRDVYVAPRECGKSTWAFLVLPLWAACHGYSRFTAAFSDTAGQARTHLMTFKRELETNDRLRLDFPELCAPATRGKGNTVSDRQDMYVARNGFAFTAMGIDGPAHGLKIGEVRPDLLILDDISGGIGNVTLYEEAKRLETLQGSILYLNQAARVLLTGTTTINGGLIHQLVQGKESWVEAENFRVHYYPALYKDESGAARSVWPAKWPVPWLEQERLINPREFARNMMNQPVPTSFAYWEPADFRYGRLAITSRRVISIDPAVTTAKTSDETAVAVVSYSVAERKACVDEVRGLRVKGEPLRQHVLELIKKYPDVTEILFERNQGGDMMAESVLHTMPRPVKTVHATEKKELRAERLLNYYRRGAVLHAVKHPDLEAQQQEFPNGLHDDLIDAVGQAVDEFAAVPRRTTLQQATR